MSYNIEEQELLKNAKDKFIKTEFFEKVTKYIQYDDLIKKESSKYKKAVETLKTEKIDLEFYLLKYLESKNGDLINYDGGKLQKVESIKKSAINKDIMKQAILEDLKKEGFIKNNEQGEKILERMFDSMENKREVQSVIKLKRIQDKPPKEKKPKTKK